jgi:hypothetical protein
MLEIGWEAVCVSLEKCLQQSATFGIVLNSCCSGDRLTYLTVNDTILKPFT